MKEVEEQRLQRRRALLETLQREIESNKHAAEINWDAARRSNSAMDALAGPMRDLYELTTEFGRKPGVLSRVIGPSLASKPAGSIGRVHASGEPTRG